MLQTAAELPRRAQNHLICFLACAFRPQDHADELVSFVQAVCTTIGQEIGAQIECIRADLISRPGTIHTDIWRYIQLADALIFDVTGLNGNVLLELGVAAAARPRVPLWFCATQTIKPQRVGFYSMLHPLVTSSIGVPSQVRPSSRVN